MKKISAVIFLFLFLCPFSHAIEEVVLDVDEPGKAGFPDYLSDVYYGKVEQASPLLKIFSKDGLRFENSFFNSAKLGFLYSEDMTYENDGNEGKSFIHKFAALEPSFKTSFNDNKSEFSVSYNLSRSIKQYNHNFAEKFSLLCISHKITPEQTILLGQGTRVPLGYDGAINHSEIPFVIRSQIGRNLGNVRSVGIRNIAKYKYAEYDIGFYDSTRYMQNFGKGTEFAGFLMLKPLGDNAENPHNVRLGGGYNVGKYHISYNQYDLFASYDYKKFHIQGEYAQSDGSNGITETRSDAYGFYSHASYKINPKLEILVRADYYTPDKRKPSENSTELTAGITYKPFKNLKFMLNYARRINSHSKDSDIILFATRFII